MTAALRSEIRSLVAAALPGALALFDDNEPVRGAALDNGYLRLSLSLEESGSGLGAHLPRLGRLGMVIAVPAGGGSAKSDSIIDSLNTGLSFGGDNTIRFGGLAVTPGRQIGQHWVIDTEISFASWPAPTPVPAPTPGTAGGEG